MTRNADTPFDPDTVPRALTTGALPPEIPFMPARDSGPTFEVKNEDNANWVVRKIVEARIPPSCDAVCRARAEAQRARRSVLRRMSRRWGGEPVDREVFH